tara:strand:- start:3075 stop:3317 length:243 start_codon:yes stop_codon:yes gene_type:complete
LIYLFFDFAIFPHHFFSLFGHGNLINIAGIDDDLFEFCLKERSSFDNTADFAQPATPETTKRHTSRSLSSRRKCKRVSAR